MPLLIHYYPCYFVVISCNIPIRVGFHLVFTEPHLFQQLLFAAKAPGPPRPVEGTASAHGPCAAAEQLALREVARQAGDFSHEESGEGSHLSPDFSGWFYNGTTLPSGKLT